MVWKKLLESMTGKQIQSYKSYKSGKSGQSSQSRQSDKLGNLAGPTGREQCSEDLASPRILWRRPDL